MRTQNVNFTGIYKISNTQENIKIIEEKVIPMYNLMRHENVVGINCDNPLAIGIEFIKEKVGKSQGASKEWLMMNARRFGIELPELNTDNLFIVSGNKDIMKFAQYFQQRLKANTKGPLARFFAMFKPKVKHSQDLPEHLKSLPQILEDYNKESSLYREFLSKENVITVKTPQELLTKMMTEK